VTGPSVRHQRAPEIQADALAIREHGQSGAVGEAVERPPYSSARRVERDQGGGGTDGAWVTGRSGRPWGPARPSGRRPQGGIGEGGFAARRPNLRSAPLGPISCVSRIRPAAALRAAGALSRVSLAASAAAPARGRRLGLAAAGQHVEEDKRQHGGADEEGKDREQQNLDIRWLVIRGARGYRDFLRECKNTPWGAMSTPSDPDVKWLASAARSATLLEDGRRHEAGASQAPKMKGATGFDEVVEASVARRGPGWPR